MHARTTWSVDTLCSEAPKSPWLTISILKQYFNFLWENVHEEPLQQLMFSIHCCNKIARSSSQFKMAFSWMCGPLWMCPTSVRQTRVTGVLRCPCLVSITCCRRGTVPEGVGREGEETRLRTCQIGCAVHEIVIDKTWPEKWSKFRGNRSFCLC